MKKYPYLIGGAVFLCLLFTSFLNLWINANQLVALSIIAYLGAILGNKPQAALFETPAPDKALEEVKTFLKEIGASWKEMKEMLEVFKNIEGGFAKVKELPNDLKFTKDELVKLQGECNKWRKQMLDLPQGQIRMGQAVSDECARWLGANAIQNGEIQGKLGKHHARQRLLDMSKEITGIEIKAAITAGDIPLPTAYASQVVELVYKYGTARRLMTVYPLGMATTKLPRLKLGEPQFSFVQTSGVIAEKVPQVEFVTFSPGKAGGIVRIPSEIDADSIVAIGQFVARYIAREMALWEDYCLFLADGTATYNSITGIALRSTTDGYVILLPAGKTAPSDITIDNLRDLRSMVHGAVLATAKYMMHPTMEAKLVRFNTLNNPNVYQRSQGGQPATLDGFPIEWVPIMPTYGLSANPGAAPVHFGDPNFWYMGERASMSVETSREVFFATDEIAIRALERFDQQQMGKQSTASLVLAAA